MIGRRVAPELTGIIEFMRKLLLSLAAFAVAAPASAGTIVFNNAGSVSTSRVSIPACGVSAKCAAMPASDGVMVAAAITVSVLHSSSVSACARGGVVDAGNGNQPRRSPPSTGRTAPVM